MPLSSIVTIVLRLFSLHWLVQGIIAITSTASMTTRSSVFDTDYWVFLPSAAMLIMAILLLMWSRTIGRMVTPQPDGQVQLGGLTQYDLYCFAFTFLGLYYVLSSLGTMINWLHYAIVTARGAEDGGAERTRAFYGFTDQFLTLFAGIVSLLFAPRFARKLAQVQRKEVTAS